MDILESIIQRLSAREVKEFKNYLGSSTIQRKDAQLFALLLRDPKMPSETLRKKLYVGQADNTNAYHSLRKQLTSELQDFIVHQRWTGDQQEEGKGKMYLSMASFAMERGLPIAARHYYLKGEKHFQRTLQFSELDTLYHAMIEHLDVLELQDTDIVERWKANTQRFEAEQRLNTAYRMIRFELIEARLRGKVLDVERVIRDIFEHMRLSSQEMRDVAYMYRIVEMARSAAVSAKDYVRFVPFLAKTVAHLSSTGALQESPVQYRIGLWYMMAHANYRIRKLKQAANCLDELEKQVPKNAIQQSAFYGKMVALRAAVASFTGENKLAIELVKQILSDERWKSNMKERLNMQLNLAVYYFQSAQYKTAYQVLLQIDRSDDWLERTMGLEWRFKKQMIEVIVLYEYAKEDIALNLIRSMERHYSHFLSEPIYQRAGFFLNFIKRIIDRPDIVHHQAFIDAVEQANLAWPKEREDIQAITFFCWLKSKMVGVDYYTVLVEAMNALEDGNDAG
ncbi:MAG: hypothetical protein RLZZ262_2624 [Bacteroidota bacterium]|jgi:hypothetical protein